MSQQITVKVSDEVVRQASQIATHSKRRVEDVLAAWLEAAANELPVGELPDDEVRRLSEMQLSQEQQSALSDLLALNSEGKLDTARQRQLDELMRLYEDGLLRKSQALRVAVQRGLIPPLTS